jgi:hypothetical protein
MKPAIHNITLYQGASFDLTIRAFDANNAAVNLTGYTARAYARETASSASMSFSLAPTIANTTVDAITTSSFLFSLSVATVLAFPAGRFEWDLVLTETATGKVTGPFVAGIVTVKPLASR